MKVTKLEWNAHFPSRPNREGIPEHTGLRFNGIFDLDYICEQVGGEKIYTIRLPFSPYIHGALENRAGTLYRLGDLLVHNEVRGRYPNLSTSIFLEGGVPEDEVVRRFTKYYGVSPRVAESTQPNIEQAQSNILADMASSQSNYEGRNLFRQIIEIMECIPEERRDAVASVIVDQTRQLILRH